MSLRRASAAVASAVLVGTLATVPAGTAVASPAAKQFTGVQLFSPGAAKVSTTWSWDPVPAGDVTTAYVEQSFWGTYPTTRSARYGLRADGALFRWTNGFRTVASYPGFAAVKAITLISETKTYDTFLATTRGGALYTIRIPATTPMKPIVKQVRTSTWQGFEHLVAEKCGAQSTLLTAIDKDTGSAYLYAVGHANGTATVIKGLGKLPGTYQDPVYSLHTADAAPPLFGD